MQVSTREETPVFSIPVYSAISSVDQENANFRSDTLRQTPVGRLTKNSKIPVRNRLRNRNTNVAPARSPLLTIGEAPSDDSDSENSDDAILEESPCGRWTKQKTEVKQRDVPGTDAAYLAMDTEEGFEVVWNEVNFAPEKDILEGEEKINQTFQPLIELGHPNIVKFYAYWIDKDKRKMVFISEYMSSGSLKQFFKTIKSNQVKPSLPTWKRWCVQLLNALNYLHSIEPLPVIHGGLTTETIFIQHDGLLKIGRISPNKIYRLVKTREQQVSNVRHLQPEYFRRAYSTNSTAMDIFAFGVCALEAIVLEIHNGNRNKNEGFQPPPLCLLKALWTVGNIQQKDFIRRCLFVSPSARPSARHLLHHPSLVVVQSLKFIAASVVTKNEEHFPKSRTIGVIRRNIEENRPLADVTIPGGGKKVFQLSDVPKVQGLESFVEDARFGIQLLDAFLKANEKPNNNVSASFRRLWLSSKSKILARALPPNKGRYIIAEKPCYAGPCSIINSGDLRIERWFCELTRNKSSDEVYTLLLDLGFEEGGVWNKEVKCEVSPEFGDPEKLCDELLSNRVIHEADKDIVKKFLAKILERMGEETPCSIVVGGIKRDSGLRN